MKRIAAICIVALAITISACDKERTPATYVGTWVKGNTTLILNDNKTYTLTDTIAMYAATGTYQVKVNAVDDILFTDNAGGMCSDSVNNPTGYYTFAYRVNSTSGTGTFHRNLTINLISDTCTVRGTTISGTYEMPEEE